MHDWLTGMRGGENVLEQMIEVLGPRDLYTFVSIEDNTETPDLVILFRRF